MSKLPWTPPLSGADPFKTSITPPRLRLIGLSASSPEGQFFLAKHHKAIQHAYFTALQQRALGVAPRIDMSRPLPNKEGAVHVTVMGQEVILAVEVTPRLRPRPEVPVEEPTVSGGVALMLHDPDTGERFLARLAGRDGENPKWKISKYNGPAVIDEDYGRFGSVAGKYAVSWDEVLLQTVEGDPEFGYSGSVYFGGRRVWGFSLETRTDDLGIFPSGEILEVYALHGFLEKKALYLVLSCYYLSTFSRLVVVRIDNVLGSEPDGAILASWGDDEGWGYPYIVLPSPSGKKVYFSRRSPTVAYAPYDFSRRFVLTFDDYNVPSLNDMGPASSVEYDDRAVVIEASRDVGGGGSNFTIRGTMTTTTTGEYKYLIGAYWDVQEVGEERVELLHEVFDEGDASETITLEWDSGQSGIDYLPELYVNLITIESSRNGNIGWGGVSIPYTSRFEREDRVYPDNEREVDLIIYERPRLVVPDPGSWQSSAKFRPGFLFFQIDTLTADSDKGDTYAPYTVASSETRVYSLDTGALVESAPAVITPGGGFNFGGRTPIPQALRDFISENGNYPNRTERTEEYEESDAPNSPVSSGFYAGVASFNSSPNLAIGSIDSHSVASVKFVDGSGKTYFTTEHSAADELPDMNATDFRPIVPF